MMLRNSKSNTRPWIILLVVAMLAVAGCAPATTAAPAAPTAIPATAVAVPTTLPAVGNSSAAASAAPLPAEISVAEAAAKREAGAFMLDVRTPEEWNEYHIPGSTLIPLDQLETRLNEVPKDKEVVVVCRSGNRSKPGRDALKAAGYTQVTSMSGGLKEWQAANQPTVTGP
jgi:rhodanese-related sulfurtransferase